MNSIDKAEQIGIELVEVARQLVIETQDQYIQAVEFGKVIKNAMNEAKSFIDPIVEKAHQAHKEATAQRNRLEKPFKEAMDIIKIVGGKYQEKREKELREQQKELERKAREKEEADRAKLLEQAEIATIDGDLEQAQKITEKAQTLEAIIPIIPEHLIKTKVEGTSVRKTWKFEIVDASLIPSEYLMPDEKKIGAVVKALAENCKIAGVRIYSETKAAF